MHWLYRRVGFGWLLAQLFQLRHQPGSVDYNPSWSPDGDWIAFTSERAGSADLFRVHPDGTGLERLTDNAAFRA